MSPESAALLADLAQIDPLQAMADAVIERNKGTRLGEKLREVLGKALVAGVAGLLVLTYKNEPICDIQAQKKVPSTITSLYIVSSSTYRQVKRFMRWIGYLLAGFAGGFAWSTKRRIRSGSARTTTPAVGWMQVSPILMDGVHGGCC